MRIKLGIGMLPLTTMIAAAGLAGFMSTVNAAPGDAERAYGKVKLGNNAYIVQMADAPVSAYKGDIKGYQATKPKNGQKIDPNAPAVVGYMAYLAARQDAALASVGASRKHYNYGYVFSGFAADLTPAQAQKLVQLPGVLAVSKDEFREVDTATTPDFLGLSGTNGFWAGKATGENIIIGIVDSGVWPEHPSFSDRTGSNGNATQDGKLDYHQIPGWNGKCVPGEAFNASDCNQKLIGARYYNAGFGGNAGIDKDLPFEFNSPRDHNGHGSHTASTAGGNRNVKASGDASAFGSINGIAPRARIAAYKACWSVPGTAGSCSGVDLLAAIDQAVADGVDVINYSISGSRTNFRDAVEIAFLNAADAGVFVAASAGNSGPTAATVAHPSPWITTVAAGTHNRNGEGSVTLGNGVSYAGASYAKAIGSLPLVDAAASGLATADPTTLARCYGTADGQARLDPVKVSGKIVVCDRGGNALVNKAAAVKEAGGLGMVLVNTPTSATTTLAILHVVPAVHLPSSAYTPIKAYVASAGAAATINAAAIVLNAPAPTTAAFSSRGPLQASGNLLKPDVIAPGQDILAAVAPPNNSGKLFDLYSGTSMSSPHVAGLGALMKQLHPDWSPMAIKSALMTTAYDVIDAGVSDATRIFRQGAGHVDPNKAANPGLVFDSSYADWLGFLCGTQLPTSFCTGAGVPVLDPSNFNVASIAVGALAGSKTVKRKVTNVSGSAATYTASYTGLGGMAVVLPAAITIAPGQTKEFEVKFTRSTATLNTYVGGQLTLTSGTGTKVRVPMVMAPVALAAPASVTAAPGGSSYEVTFGYDGAFTATPRGLIPATTSNGSVATDGVVDFQVSIPAGTSYARFALFDTEVDQASDLDLEVYNAAGVLVASSGGATTAEEANLTNPAVGEYKVRVLGFAVPVGSANFKLFTWVLGSAAAGNLTVTAPATAATATTGTISLGFNSLTAGTKYLGSVAYGGVIGMPSPTIVTVNP